MRFIVQCLWLLSTILCLTVHSGLVCKPIKASCWLQFVAAVRNVAQLTPTYRYQFQNMRDWYFIVTNDYQNIVPAFLHSLDLQVSRGLCWQLDRAAETPQCLHSPSPGQHCCSHCAALQQRAQPALCRALPVLTCPLSPCLKQGVCLQDAFRLCKLLPLPGARVMQLRLVCVWDSECSRLPTDILAHSL